MPGGGEHHQPGAGIEVEDGSGARLDDNAHVGAPLAKKMRLTGPPSVGVSMDMENVPGPKKTKVVVKDVAYKTYYAFLYYVGGLVI